MRVYMASGYIEESKQLHDHVIGFGSSNVLFVGLQNPIISYARLSCVCVCVCVGARARALAVVALFGRSPWYIRILLGPHHHRLFSVWL